MKIIKILFLFIVALLLPYKIGRTLWCIWGVNSGADVFWTWLAGVQIILGVAAVFCIGWLIVNIKKDRI